MEELKSLRNEHGEVKIEKKEKKFKYKRDEHMH